MTQMNLPMKQKQTHRLVIAGGGGGGGRGEGWTGSLGLADANYYTQNVSTTRS